MTLNQDVGAYNHKTVLTARKEDYHSTIFAQLEAGEYHIKFSFVSDAALLQLPCQTIQLEIAMMTVTNAKAKAERLKAGVPAGAASSLSLHDLFFNAAADAAPLTLYRPARVGWRHVTPGLFPHVDQSELYVQILREGFEIAEDDDAGLDIELQSDFLLSGVNVAISNVETGSVIEDERTDSSGKLLVSRLQPGAYELILYTHECATNMDPAHGTAISSFDLLLSMKLRLVRIVTEGATGTEGAKVPLEILDSSANGVSGGAPAVKETHAAAPLLLSASELWCHRHYHQLPRSLDQLMQLGSLDLSETFFAPVTSFYS